MLFSAGARRKIADLLSGTARLCKDRRGVAAIEFAFLAPVLLGMYFVTMEISQGIETNKKVGRVASMVADLVTQRATLNKAEIKAIMDIGSSTLQPYKRSSPTITVSEISIGPLSGSKTEPDVTVVWSRKLAGTTYGAGTGTGIAAGTKTTVPDSLKIPGTYLIRVQAQLSYLPVIAWAATDKAAAGLSAAFSNIPMSETYYLKARMTQSVDCSDC